MKHFKHLKLPERFQYPNSIPGLNDETLSLPAKKPSMNPNFNPDKQHTLKECGDYFRNGSAYRCYGGPYLQTGKPGFGFQFQRIDLPAQPIIKADCDLVTDISRGTTLEANGAKVSTVEHVLAALVEWALIIA